MPVYLRKNVNYTPASIDKLPPETDDDFITDPEQLTDYLPQPYRLLDKILNSIVEDAWYIIEERENVRLEEAKKVRPPKYESFVGVEETRDVSSIAATPDGKYVILGLCKGISILDSLTQARVCDWEEEKVDIVNIEVYSLSENAYLLVTVSDLGLARLHIFSEERLHLVKVLNEQQDLEEEEEKSSSKTLIHKCEASSEGEYLGSLVEHPHSGDMMLEFFKLPVDAWLQELENFASAQKSESTKQTEKKPEEQETAGDETITSDTAPQNTEVALETSHHDQKTSIKFSQPSFIMKLKPPPFPEALLKRGNLAPSVSATCQKVDQGDVIGTGQNHILTTSNLELRKELFSHNYKNLLQYLPKESELAPVSRMATFHFLTPGRLVYQSGESPRTPNSPTSVAVWWQGSTHIMHYSLFKTPSKDGEYKPDVVWPFTSRISTTTVSADTSLLAVGLVNGNIVLWDRYLGMQRGVVNITNSSSVSDIWFLEPSICPQDDGSYPPYLTKTSCFMLILCGNGAMYYMMCTPGQQLVPMPVSPEVENDLDQFTRVETVPGKPDLLVTVVNKGVVQIRHALQGVVLLEVELPSTYELFTPWSPIVTTGSMGEFLYIRGLLKDEDEEAEKEGKEEVFKSKVFVYNMGKFPTLDAFNHPARKPVPFNVHTNLDKRVEDLMTERIAQQALRKTRMQERWGLMKEEIWSILQYKEQAQRKAEQRPVVTFNRVYHYQQTPGSVGWDPLFT